tara:strand:+ start:5017 stop:5619 length:603 start_codon:yes stop_codon:yes gene_type:complete
LRKSLNILLIIISIAIIGFVAMILFGVSIMGTKTDCAYFGKHLALGTWSKCHKDGSYVEHKITEQYMLILTTKRPDEIIIFGNKVLDENLISYQLKNGTKILTDNDTLVTIEHSSNKIVLMSTWGFNKYELNKAEFDYEEIDSTNLKLWKKKTLTEFHKRAESKKCPDLRTVKEKAEVEKVTPELKLEELEDIRIENIEN